MRAITSTSLLRATVAAALLLAACGEDSSEPNDGAAPTDSTDVTVAATASPTTTDTTAETATDATTAMDAPSTNAPTNAPTTAPPTTAAPTTEPASTLPAPAPWSGPRFDTAITATMDALGAVVGQPFDPAALPADLAVPDPTPLPAAATVTGAGWVSEYDSFFERHEQTTAIGLDLPIDAAGLQAWWDAGIAGWTAASFAVSGSLSTALLVDPSDQRLVYVLDADSATSGRPLLNLEWSPASDAVREPDWLASLPLPEGGTVTEVLAARGLVSVDFGSGFDGNVFVRVEYAPTELDRLVEYFEGGILLGAGFTYEPTPLSNAQYRRDLAIGEWSGQVAIGEVTSNSELVSLEVTWSLSRA